MRGEETTTKRRQNKRARTEDILRAAREVFAAKGFDGATVAEIASKVGLVEGALYRHFPSKRDLLHAVIERRFVPLIEDFERVLPGIEGHEEKLHFIVWRSLRALLEESAISMLIVREIRPHAQYYQSIVHELNRRYTGYALHTLRDGMAAGVFRDDVPAAMVRDAIYGGLEHIAWATLTAQRPIDEEETARQLTQFVLRGIRSAAREPAPMEETAARLERAASRIERALDAGGNRKGKERP